MEDSARRGPKKKKMWISLNQVAGRRRLMCLELYAGLLLNVVVTVLKKERKQEIKKEDYDYL